MKDYVESSYNELWLLGQPSLESYINFIDELAIESAKVSRYKLVDEWRTANDYYAELEETEAGIADEIEIRDLDLALKPLTDAVMADPRFKRSFDTLPTRFAMVELDRLVVGHPYISHHHTDRIKAQIGVSPSPEELFKFCLPLDRTEAPVEVRKMGSRSFMLWSPSSDFRFQEIVSLEAGQIRNFEPVGALGGIIAVMIGYGSNFLSVIQSDNRLMLHNGHHRAYALRDLGVTHAPCIIKTVTRLDELKLTAAKAVVDDPEFYFSAKRPPLLKDFFNPKIRKIVPVHSLANVVEVTIEIKERMKIRSFSGGS